MLRRQEKYAVPVLVALFGHSSFVMKIVHNNDAHSCVGKNMGSRQSMDSRHTAY